MAAAGGAGARLARHRGLAGRPSRGRAGASRAGPRHQRCGGRSALQPAAQHPELARAEAAGSERSDLANRSHRAVARASRDGSAGTPRCGTAAVGGAGDALPHAHIRQGHARQRTNRCRTGLHRGTQARRTGLLAKSLRADARGRRHRIDGTVRADRGRLSRRDLWLARHADRAARSHARTRPGGRVCGTRWHAARDHRRAPSRRHAHLHVAATGRPAGRHVDAARRWLARRARPVPQSLDCTGHRHFDRAGVGAGAAGARYAAAFEGRVRTGGNAGVPQGDGRLGHHRLAGARPARPAHLRQPGLLRNGRLQRRRIAGRARQWFGSPRCTRHARGALLADRTGARIPAAASASPGRRHATARGLRIGLHAQGRLALSGADLRGTAAQRAARADRMDECLHRCQRTAPHRRTVARQPGAAASQRAARHRRRDGLVVEPRTHAAARRHCELRERIAQPARRRRRSRWFRSSG